MTAVVYRELKNRKEIVELKEGLTIKQNLNTVDADYSIVIANGKLVKDNYVVQKGDIITIRLIPGASTAMIITGIVITVVAVTAGIVGGIMAYKAKLAAQEAMEALDKLKKQTNQSSSLDNRPFLRGASNTSATGKLQPYVCGHHFLTPYLLSNPYYELAGKDGKDQFIYTVLGLGFNNQVIDKVNIDDVTIKEFENKEIQQGSYLLDTGIFAEDGLIEISQNGKLLEALSTLNYKTISHTQNDEIPKDCEVNKGTKSHLCYTLDANAMNVDVAISFPYGLYAYNNENEKIAQSVTITPQFSLDGGKTFTSFLIYPDNITKSEKVLTGMGQAISDVVNNGTHVEYGSDIARELDRRGELEKFREITKNSGLYRDGQLDKKIVQNNTTGNYGNGSNYFNKNVSDRELRYVAHYDFSVNDYETLKANGQDNIIIRLLSNGTDDSKSHCECYCLYYQSLCFDPNKSSYPAGIKKDNKKAGLVPCLNIEDRERKFCTILALRLKSSTANEDKLKKINVLTNGLARTWDGKKWSTERTVTRNPASWALEIETSNKHPASRYADSEIDLDSFGEFYEFCEKNDFKFDHVVTQNTKKDALLGYIMEACGACLYTDIYGRRAVAIDKKQENALAVYNPQNIINIQNKKSFGRRTDGLRVKYVDSYNDNFTENTYLVMREVDGKPLELTDDSIIKDLSVTGITTHEHIVKYARRVMAIEALRPKTTIIEVGNEGIYYTPFSKVLIQDDSLKIGLSSSVIKNVEWENGYLTKLLINGIVNFEKGKQYGIIVNAFNGDKIVPLALKVKGKDKTNELIVESVIDVKAKLVPEAHNTFSFGELDENGDFTKITTPYIISQIKRSERGFNLELVNYNENIYEAGAIPDYVSNITQKAVESNAEIPPDYVTQKDLKESLDALQNGNTPVQRPDIPLEVKAFAEKDGISLSCLCVTDGLKNSIASFIFTVIKPNGTESIVETNSNNATYYFDREADGYPENFDLKEWQVKAKVINVYGKESDYSNTFSVNTDLYGTWQIECPAITSRISDRTITLCMNMPTRSDNRVVYGNIQYLVQVKRPDIDTDFYKPATSLDPYASELNYKEGEGFTTCDGIYIQTMPLKGQENNQLEDTAYMFSICAKNEAMQTGESYITATACCTSIRDLVKANETAKKSYVSSLSAISANLGAISSGTMGDSERNYWNLSTMQDDNGIMHYQGAMRVGGETQYLKVTPLVNDRQQIYDYTIEFQIGNFSLTSSSSEINGDLIIQENKDSLNRLKISPTGAFFEKRETKNSEWQTGSKITNKEVLTNIVKSNNTLVIKNTTPDKERELGHDIGRKYLSDNARVYHFDENIKDNKGNDLDIAENWLLRGSDNGYMFTPPCTTGKALYTDSKISLPQIQSNTQTIDFWLKDTSTEGKESVYIEGKKGFQKEFTYKVYIELFTKANFQDEGLQESLIDFCYKKLLEDKSYKVKDFYIRFLDVLSLKGSITVSPCFSISFYNDINMDLLCEKLKLIVFDFVAQDPIWLNSIPDLKESIEIRERNKRYNNKVMVHPYCIKIFCTNPNTYTSEAIEYIKNFSLFKDFLQMEDFTILQQKIDIELVSDDLICIYFNLPYILTNKDMEEISQKENAKRYFYIYKSWISYFSDIVLDSFESLTLTRSINNKLLLSYAGDELIEKEERIIDGIPTTVRLEDSEKYTKPFNYELEISENHPLFFNRNEWVHLGLSIEDKKIIFRANQSEYSFDKVNASNNNSYSTIINSSNNTILLDELYIDTATQNLNSFIECTNNPVPWGSLDYSENWFILDAQNPNHVKTNLFENDLIRQTIIDIAHPIGTIYTQLPQQEEPEVLFGGKWENVSNLYAGDFFRAEGGDSLAFGAGRQPESLPNITGSYSGSCQNGSSGSGAFRTPHSSYTFEGTRGCMRTSPINFNASYSNSIYGKSEHVTPLNQTVRIWKRIA